MVPIAIVVQAIIITAAFRRTHFFITGANKQLQQAISPLNYLKGEKNIPLVAAIV
jgi:hypothetical protein